MAAGFPKNGYNSGRVLYSLWRSHSTTEPITGPGLIRNQFQQLAKLYSRPTTEYIYRKAKQIDISAPADAVSSVLSSSPSATSPGSWVSKLGFVDWYLGMLKARPIVTKSITSALIYSTADLTSQTITRQSGQSYDLIRTSRMAGYGLMLVGPSMHYWFSFLSKTIPKCDLVSTLKKMVLGQTVYGPSMTVIFFSGNAALQGESGPEIVARLKRDLIPTFINGVMYWPACDFVTFKFVPVHLQPLMSNTFAYVWTIYVTYMASREKVGAT